MCHLSKVQVASHGYKLMIISFLVERSRDSFSSAWLKRAYQRAKEEAKEEGKSLADVVAKRYGVSYI